MLSLLAARLVPIVSDLKFVDVLGVKFADVFVTSLAVVFGAKFADVFNARFMDGFTPAIRFVTRFGVILGTIVTDISDGLVDV